MTLPFVRLNETTDQLEVGPGLRVLGPVTLAGATQLGGDLDCGGHRVTNLGGPAAASDAATKAYVDSVVPGGGAAGPATSVQYNNGGAFGGDAGLTWAAGSQVLRVAGAQPRLLVGAGPADAGAALQLKTDAGAAPQALAAAAVPTQVTLQSRATTTGAASATLQVLRLADRTFAYCDVTVLGVVTAGAPGQANAYRRRFVVARDDAGPGTTVGPVTDDFTQVQTAGVSLTVTVSGTDLAVLVGGAAGMTLVWDAHTTARVSAGW